MQWPYMFVELEAAPVVAKYIFPSFVSHTNFLCAFEFPGVTEEQFKERPSYSQDMDAVYAKSKL